MLSLNRAVNARRRQAYQGLKKNQQPSRIVAHDGNWRQSTTREGVSIPNSSDSRWFPTYSRLIPGAFRSSSGRIPATFPTAPS